LNFRKHNEKDEGNKGEVLRLSSRHFHDPEAVIINRSKWVASGFGLVFPVSVFQFGCDT